MGKRKVELRERDSEPAKKKAKRIVVKVSSSKKKRSKSKRKVEEAEPSPPPPDGVPLAEEEGEIMSDVSGGASVGGDVDASGQISGQEELPDNEAALPPGEAPPSGAEIPASEKKDKKKKKKKKKKIKLGKDGKPLTAEQLAERKARKKAKKKRKKEATAAGASKTDKDKLGDDKKKDRDRRRDRDKHKDSKRRDRDRDRDGKSGRTSRTEPGRTSRTERRRSRDRSPKRGRSADRSPKTKKREDDKGKERKRSRDRSRDRDRDKDKDKEKLKERKHSPEKGEITDELEKKDDFDRPMDNDLLENDEFGRPMARDEFGRPIDDRAPSPPRRRERSRDRRDRDRDRREGDRDRDRRDREPVVLDRFKPGDVRDPPKPRSRDRGVERGDRPRSRDRREPVRDRGGGGRDDKNRGGRDDRDRDKNRDRDRRDTRKRSRSRDLGRKNRDRRSRSHGEHKTRKKRKLTKKQEEEEYRKKVEAELAKSMKPDEQERFDKDERRRRQAERNAKVKVAMKQEIKIKQEPLDDITTNGTFGDLHAVKVKIEKHESVYVPAVKPPPKIKMRRLLDESETKEFTNVIEGAVDHVVGGSEAIWDIFSEDENEDDNVAKATAALDMQESQENLFNVENWDDSESYYIFRLGDVVQGRYEVFANQGRGVFSSVLRVRDLESNTKEEEYVIKVIRNNDTMRKAGMKEIEHLLLIGEMDPNNTKHCVRLFNHFDHRNHLCLVFEPLNCNLRQLIKQVGAGRGFHIRAVMTYAKQMFKALQHLVRCRIIHADIKPDNILIGADHNIVKICDFGSAMKPEEVELTPILGSRYYRAAEVMTGHLATFSIDMWAIGCVLAEIYTGKILFRGDPDNNRMMAKIIPLCGRYPTKYGRAGMFWAQHFDENGDFLETTEDVNGMQMQKRHGYTKPQKEWLHVLHPITAHYKTLNAKEKTKVSQFKELLIKCFALDPSKRITPQQSLLHPFVQPDKKKSKKKRKK